MKCPTIYTMIRWIGAGLCIKSPPFSLPGPSGPSSAVTGLSLGLRMALTLFLQTPSSCFIIFHLLLPTNTCLDAQRSPPINQAVIAWRIPSTPPQRCCSCASPCLNAGCVTSPLKYSSASREKSSNSKPSMGDDISAELGRGADGGDAIFGGVHGTMRVASRAAAGLPLRAQLLTKACQQRRTLLLQPRLRLLWQPCTVRITPLWPTAPPLVHCL